MYNPYTYTYTYAYDNDGDHGMKFNPSLGLRVAIGKKSALTTSLGYKLYYLHTNGVYYTDFKNQTFRPDAHGYYLFNALTIKAGFQF